MSKIVQGMLAAGVFALIGGQAFADEAKMDNASRTEIVRPLGGYKGGPQSTFVRIKAPEMRSEANRGSKPHFVYNVGARGSVVVIPQEGG